MIIRKLATLLIFMTPLIAYAETPGPYAGIGFGLGRLHTQGTQADGLSGRAAAGFNFNEYLGLEAGVTVLNASMQNKMRAVDVVGKAYVPLTKRFNIYGLAGAAGVDNKINSHHHKNVRPRVGAGVGYHVTSNFTVGVEFSRIQGVGNTKTSSRAIPNSNMVMMNFTYNFK